MKGKTGIKKNPLLEDTERREKNQFASIPVNQPLSKATFYFFPDQLKELERIKWELFSKHNIRTDKSDIMRKVLDIIIKDTSMLVNQYASK